MLQISIQIGEFDFVVTIVYHYYRLTQFPIFQILFLGRL